MILLILIYILNIIDLIQTMRLLRYISIDAEHNILMRAIMKKSRALIYIIKIIVPALCLACLYVLWYHIASKIGAVFIFSLYSFVVCNNLIVSRKYRIDDETNGDKNEKQNKV